MTNTQFKLSTAHGALAISDTGGSGVPLVLLHGSGASGEVFRSQFQSPLANHFRMIAIDLPGHGGSDRFSDPAQTYALPEVARSISGLFPRLGIDRAVVMGWSLGGHIAIEMMASAPDQLAGVMIAGTPPIDTGPLSSLRAFHLNPTILLVSKSRLSHTDAEKIARMCYGDQASAEHVKTILATDPAMRLRITRSLLKADGANQKATVETSPIPLAVVHGETDPAVRTSFLNNLSYANLWEGKVHVIKGVGHAPFMAAPNSFNALLHRFATEVSITHPARDKSAVARRA